VAGVAHHWPEIGVARDLRSGIWQPGARRLRSRRIECRTLGRPRVRLGIDLQHHGRGGLDQSAKPGLLSVEPAADLDPEVEQHLDLIAPLVMAVARTRTGRP